MVIAIAGAIAGVAWPALASYVSVYRLEGATRTVALDIQNARGRAISEGKCFRVTFTSLTYTVQRATSGACTSSFTVDNSAPAPLNVALKVEDAGIIGVENANSPGAMPVSPIFTPRGESVATAGAYPSIRLSNPMGASRLVLVNMAGQVVVQ